MTAGLQVVRILSQRFKKKKIKLISKHTILKHFLFKISIDPSIIILWRTGLAKYAPSSVVKDIFQCFVTNSEHYTE